MPDINDINGLAVGSINDINGVLKADIADINGLTIPSAAAFLLDTTYGSGAAAAYSVRKLDKDYTGNCMRIRRDSDDSETDIGFDSSGDLDTAAIASHCGSANGYCVTWFDQSGNSANVTQSASIAQPQIYNGTAVITENGKPALYFNIDKLGISSVSWGATRTIFTVLEPVAFDGFDPVFGTRDGSANFAALVGTTGNYKMQQHASGQFTNVDTGIAITTDQQLIYTLFDGTGSEIGKDASTAVSVSLKAASAGNHSISSRGTDSGDGEFYIQEHIIYTSDQSSNRTAIETNINSDYLIYQPTDQPTSGLLYDYGSQSGGTDAAVAYSVRQLSDKAVICMRIRRDSDDEERNIGFDANGDLATADIAAFCGTANGYVTRWWDQSTNGNHADQATDANQPKIYNGFAVITENGQAALEFDGTDYLDASSGTVTQPFTIFQVSNLTRQGSFQTFYSGIGSRTSDATWGSSTLRVGVYSGQFNVNSSSDLPESQVLMTNLHATTSVHRRDGTQYASGNGGTNNIVDFRIGGINNANFRFVGTMQSVIFYDSDQTSNFTGIETNIDNYFQIPGM